MKKNEELYFNDVYIYKLTMMSPILSFDCKIDIYGEIITAQDEYYQFEE